MDQIGWKELKVGCVIEEPGNASQYLTGSWRTRRPVVDHDACTQCAQCWMHCPDVAIHQQEDGRYEADLDYCKGCGICAEVCPVGCIELKEEG